MKLRKPVSNLQEKIRVLTQKLSAKELVLDALIQEIETLTKEYTKALESFCLLPIIFSASMNLETVHVRHLWLGMLTSLDIRRSGYLIDKNEKYCTYE